MAICDGIVVKIKLSDLNALAEELAAATQREGELQADLNASEEAVRSLRSDLECSQSDVRYYRDLYDQACAAKRQAFHELLEERARQQEAQYSRKPLWQDVADRLDHKRGDDEPRCERENRVVTLFNLLRSELQSRGYNVK